MQFYDDYYSKSQGRTINLDTCLTFMDRVHAQVTNCYLKQLTKAVMIFEQSWYLRTFDVNRKWPKHTKFVLFIFDSAVRLIMS